MNRTKQSGVSLLTGLAIALAALSFTTTARANVYATDIQLNSTLTGAVSVAGGSSVTLAYHLNDNATTGVTIKILSGATVVSTTSIASPNAGTLFGLNTVSLTAPSTPGTYSVSITAGATGYSTWTQISQDTSAGMPAHFPLGIAVDNNKNSPYYGRVVMGCALHTGTVNTPPAAMQTGLFKMNADGSQADEGWYGNAGYLADDAGDAPVAGQMPDSGGFDPMKIRIGDDDRIYWVDNSNLGAIIACDMQATTNQIVINEAGYATNPDHSDLAAGFQEFDVAFTTTTNASLWLCDNDFPNWGVWMYHMTNGVADPADTEGTQAVFAGSPSDLSLVSSGGCMVDNNLDIFVGQDRNNENAVYDAMVYTNWNGGILPPEAGGFGFAYGTAANQVEWGYGSGVDAVSSTDPTFEGMRDVVINSRIHPTIVACPCSVGSQATPGIRLLNALNATVTITSVSLSGTTLTINCTSSSSYAPVLSQLSLVGSSTANGTYAPVTATFTGGNGVFQATTTITGPTGFYRVAFPATGGSIVTVENTFGTVTQSMTNLDFGQAYTCAAWDNVGNLYGASTTRNLWRVYSPPGANANTTVAVATLTSH